MLHSDLPASSIPNPIKTLNNTSTSFDQFDSIGFIVHHSSFCPEEKGKGT